MGQNLLTSILPLRLTFNLLLSLVVVNSRTCSLFSMEAASLALTLEQLRCEVSTIRRLKPYLPRQSFQARETNSEKCTPEMPSEQAQDWPW
jgi:hypothetical protein